jgi:hypothetical protein
LCQFKLRHLFDSPPPLDFVSLSGTAGGKEILEQVASAFNQSKQQQQSQFDLGATDPDVFELFADLHDQSVLYLDGRDYFVTFPYPEGLEAFEGALNRVRINRRK